MMDLASKFPSSSNLALRCDSACFPRGVSMNGSPTGCPCWVSVPLRMPNYFIRLRDRQDMKGQITHIYFKYLDTVMQ